MEYTTTLKRLRYNNACKRGYDLIANHVGSDFTGEINLLTILEVNGLDDCIWALRATDGGKELAVAYAIYCAEPYYTEPSWVKWASGWMACTDRTETAEWAARAAAGAAGVAWAAWAAGEAWAAWAAWAAAGAAGAAAGAAAWAAWAAGAAGAADRKRQISIIRRLLGDKA